MESIVEIANRVKSILEESQHFKELSTKDYLNDLLLHNELKNVYNDQDPSFYEKKNNYFAHRYVVYNKKINDSGKPMEVLTDENRKIISEDEFKKKALELYNIEFKDKGLDEIIVEDALDDFIKKIKREMDGEKLY